MNAKESRRTGIDAMPYIPQKDRARILAGATPRTAGELNYAITIMLCRYIVSKENISYQVYNEVLGVLEAVKLELYRRCISPYEDLKCKSNGEVYDL